jgi:hypothetical protein
MFMVLAIVRCCGAVGVGGWSFRAVLALPGPHVELSRNADAMGIGRMSDG